MVITQHTGTAYDASSTRLVAGFLDLSREGTRRSAFGDGGFDRCPGLRCGRLAVFFRVFA